MNSGLNLKYVLDLIDSTLKGNVCMGVWVCLHIVFSSRFLLLLPPSTPVILLTASFYCSEISVPVKIRSKTLIPPLDRM